MLSAESRTITSSDESDSGYDTDDATDTKSNEYGDSSYYGSDEYDFECNDERSGNKSDPYDEECYGDTHSMRMNGKDNESYERNGHKETDEDGYVHSDDNHSADFNNSEDNAGIAHICYFFNTPRG